MQLITELELIFPFIVFTLYFMPQIFNQILNYLRANIDITYPMVWLLANLYLWNKTLNVKKIETKERKGERKEGEGGIMGRRGRRTSREKRGRAEGLHESA